MSSGAVGSKAFTFRPSIWTLSLFLSSTDSTTFDLSNTASAGEIFSSLVKSMVSPMFIWYSRLSKEMPLPFTSTLMVSSAFSFSLPFTTAVALVVPPFRGMYFSVWSSYLTMLSSANSQS